MRSILFVLLLASNISLAQRAGSLMPPEELSQFLGPVSSKAFTWGRLRAQLTGRDFDVYYGDANPPLAGEVGFYLGGLQQITPPPSWTIITGKLGVFQVEWHRGVASDGSVDQQGQINLDGQWRGDIWVRAKKEADVGPLLEVVAQLPMFTQMPEDIK